LLGQEKDEGSGKTKGGPNSLSLLKKKSNEAPQGLVELILDEDLIKLESSTKGEPESKPNSPIDRLRGLKKGNHQPTPPTNGNPPRGGEN